MPVSFPAILLLLVTWSAVTAGLGFGVDAVERAMYRRSPVDPLGWEFWSVVAAGGGGVGGLVALTVAMQGGDLVALNATHHLLIAAFSLINVALVAMSRWLVNT